LADDKVMFYCVSTHLGGAERSLITFLELYSVDRDRKQFFILFPKPKGPLVEWAEVKNIPYKVLPFPIPLLRASRSNAASLLLLLLTAPLLVIYLLRTLFLLKREKVSAVHSTGLKCHIVCCLLSVLTPTRFVIHFRDIFTRKYIVRFLTFFSRKKNIQWLASSDAIAKNIRAIPQKVIYNGFDDKLFVPNKNSNLKKQLNIPETSPLFGIVGVIAAWKGQSVFVAAAAKVLEKCPDAHFIVVGGQIYDTSSDTNILRDLKETVAILGVEKNVHFLEFQKNITEVINGLDYSVHASLKPEPFGRVIVESMLCGTPVIAARAGGVLEIVVENQNALLHEPGNTIDLAEQMLKLLNMESSQIEILRKNAIEHCRAKFSIAGRYKELKSELEDKLPPSQNHGEKVMFYCVSTHLGGAERSLMAFLELYKDDENRKNFIMLLPKASGPLVDWAQQKNISYSILPFPEILLRASRADTLSMWMLLPAIPSITIYLSRLWWFVFRQKVDTIHCTGLKCHILACLLSPFVRSRVIVHFRDIFDSAPIGSFFDLFKHKRRIKWLSASQAIAKDFPNLNVQNVYDGFDATYYHPQRQHYLKTHLNIPLDTPLIGLVGVIARWKGQENFIRAAAKVLRSGAKAYFIIVGDQIYDTDGDKHFMEDLQDLCDELKIREFVHFSGFQKDVVKIYNSLDWLVHCSLRPEPFGRVIVEAMMCNTPVIAARGGGVLEIISDNDTGLLHEAGNVDDLAEKIKKALGMSEAEVKKMTARAQDFCRKTYILGDRYKELKEIIENYP